MGIIIDCHRLFKVVKPAFGRTRRGREAKGPKNCDDEPGQAQNIVEIPPKSALLAGPF